MILRAARYLSPRRAARAILRRNKDSCVVRRLRPLGEKFVPGLRSENFARLHPDPIQTPPAERVSVQKHRESQSDRRQK